MPQPDPPTTDPRPYRENVLGVFVNPQGLVLAVERTHHPGAWQLPQGGVDDHEDRDQAVVREMCEELGLQPSDITIVHRFEQHFVYDFPLGMDAPIARSWRGQRQTAYLLALAPDAQPDLRRADGEVRDWRWMDLDDLARGITHFKQPVYQQLLPLFHQWLAQR